jgi:16S rRNA (guanine1207-N2)-methyltransferase
MRCVTEEHYFTAEPTTTGRERTVEFTVDGRDYRLTTSGGVFSADRLDPGTSVLLHKAPLPDAATTGALLDLGCGYGPVAAVLAASAPTAVVYAVDVNARALELTRRNAHDRGANIVAGLPDEIPTDVRFAQIWSNPPIRVGKEELHNLLLRWLPRLADDGVAWLVVARHLGADSLQGWLAARGWQVDRHASQKGYRIFRVMRNSDDNDTPAQQNP